MLEVAIGGRHLRVADPDWADPLDPTFAAQPPGKRWNPPGIDCLYLNADRVTARANVGRLFKGLPYGPEDLEPTTAPMLIAVTIPDGTATDAYTQAGLAVLDLPESFPRDSAGRLISHAVCQHVGETSFAAGLDGVDARSAAEGGNRELAWFPKERTLMAESAVPFDDWWYE